MKKNISRRIPALFESFESRILLSAAPIVPLRHLGRVSDATPVVQAPGGNPGNPGNASNIVAPANLSATATSDTSVRVTWNASSGATGYNLYRSSDGVHYSQIAQGGGTSFSDTTVKGSTTYWYYVEAYKAKNTSAASSVVTVTTPAPVVVTLPAAPGNLSVAGTTTSSVSLTWSDLASNETGERLYRSTDGVTYKVVANIAAGSTSYTDGSLAAGVQYFYEVSAWNSAGESVSTAVSATTQAVVPNGNPISITTRYGGELVLAGSSGNDSIFVSQSGSTLTIVANGYTSTADVPANGLFIYSFGGIDSITVDSSVTLRATIASIDGSATSVNNGDANASVWIDSTDTFSGAGVTHKVASFYQNVTKAVGVDLTDPTDTGSVTRASGSLWGAGPVMSDVNQGSVGDCYFLCSLAAFANSMPAKLQNMAVDLGDGTYAVQYMRSGVATYVRVDADMAAGWFGGYAYAHPGGSGDIWALVMEKSYAFFRSGANTYASLNSGWMGNVYSDFGIANTNVSLQTTDSSFFSLMKNYLVNGKAVTFATFSGGTTLVSNHAYTLVSVANVGGINYYTVRNPWGVAGDGLEDGAGFATLTFAQMVANFQLGTAAV